MIKPGSVVRATACIVDTDGNGGHYLHAVPGTYGVVLPDDFSLNWPVIRWGLRGEGGVCNVSREVFEEVRDTVGYVVDGIYEE